MRQVLIRPDIRYVFIRTTFGSVGVRFPLTMRKRGVSVQGLYMNIDACLVGIDHYLWFMLLSCYRRNWCGVDEERVFEDFE